AQKNLGPVGISVLVVRRDLLERAGQPRADIFNYASHAARDSMLNTPPTWNWYLLGLTVRWMLEQGGVEEFARRNAAKSALVYGAIDGSGGFYRNEVAPEVRSRMNIPFFLPDETLTARFVSESKAAGLLALKGHKAVGGLRASLYNAMPLEGAQALAEFTAAFQRRNRCSPRERATAPAAARDNGTFDGNQQEQEGQREEAGPASAQQGCPGGSLARAGPAGAGRRARPDRRH